MTNEGAEDRVSGLRGVEVAHHEQVVIFDEFVFEAGVDPIGEEPQLGGTGFDAGASAAKPSLRSDLSSLNQRKRLHLFLVAAAGVLLRQHRWEHGERMLQT